MSKLIALQVENFKRIELVEVKFDGAGVFQVMGENDAGKSSLIDALVAVLAGKKFQPDQPIRNGAEGAKVIAETDTLLITAKWTEKSYKLIVQDKKTKARYPSPQDVLSALYSQYALDPSEFLRLKPKDQAALLRDLLGLDTAELDAERQRLYDERTLVNRDHLTLSTQLSQIIIPKKPEPPGAEIDVAAASNEKIKAVETNAANAVLRKAASDAADAHKKAEEDLQKLKDMIVKAEAKVRGLLQQKNVAHNAADAARDIDTTDLDATIANANAFNRVIQANKAAVVEYQRKADEHARLAKTVADKKQKSDDLTEEMEAIDKKKADALAAAKFPVDGMTVDGDNVMVSNVPFSQISSSEQIRVSLAMAMAKSPDLRLVIVKHGDLIYDKKMEIVAEWAKKNDVLVLMERRETDGAVGVVLEEGHIKELGHGNEKKLPELLAAEAGGGNNTDA